MSDEFPPGLSESERSHHNIRIEEELLEFGYVRPPWQFLPQCSPYSIGWRMGAGESHLITFYAWSVRAKLSEEERKALVIRWQPPARWLPWCASFIWELEPDDDEEADVALLEKAGIGTVAAWREAVEDEAAEEG